MKKQLLILIALVAINSTAFAQYDFESEGFYYKITSATEPYTVEVTSKYTTHPYYNDSTAYIGNITIPTSVTHEGNDYDVTAIDSFAFAFSGGLTGAAIPNSVTVIEEGAFAECVKLASVTIPNSVISIGNNAFINCYVLTSVTIPNSVISIGEDAFYYCIDLESLTIGNSIATIEEGAFGDCHALTSVTIKATVPPTLGEYTFYEVPKDIPVYVPCQSLEAYQTATWWNEFTNIQCETGITEINTFPYEVYTRHNTLIIKQAEGQPIAIFDMMGRTIFQTTATEETTCTLPTAGVYVVRVGVKGFVRKIVIN